MIRVLTWRRPRIHHTAGRNIMWLIPPLMLPGAALALGAHPPVVWACHVFSWMAVLRLLARFRGRGLSPSHVVVLAGVGGTVVGAMAQAAFRLSPVMSRIAHADAHFGTAARLSLYEFHHAWTAAALALLSGLMYAALAHVVSRIS